MPSLPLSSANSDSSIRLPDEIPNSLPRPGSPSPLPENSSVRLLDEIPNHLQRPGSPIPLPENSSIALPDEIPNGLPRSGSPMPLMAWSFETIKTLTFVVGK
jgi:hypothetical protein